MWRAQIVGKGDPEFIVVCQVRGFDPGLFIQKKSKIVQERGAKRRHHKATPVFFLQLDGCGKSGLNSSRFVWICLVFEASTLQNVDSKQQTAVA